jgi:hypothetical protein
MSDKPKLFRVTTVLFVSADDGDAACKYVSDGLERGIPENDDCMGWDQPTAKEVTA